MEQYIIHNDDLDSVHCYEYSLEDARKSIEYLKRFRSQYTFSIYVKVNDEKLSDASE